VYVLTSAVTFSGGEQLSYDLQQLGRATIVGETTRGGANPREGFTVHPHLEATISVAAAVNPRPAATGREPVSRPTSRPPPAGPVTPPTSARSRT